MYGAIEVLRHEPWSANPGTAGKRAVCFAVFGLVLLLATLVLWLAWDAYYPVWLPWDANAFPLLQIWCCCTYPYYIFAAIDARAALTMTTHIVFVIAAVFGIISLYNLVLFWLHRTK